MMKFLQRLFGPDPLIEILRDELRAKDRQIEALQVQLDRVFQYHYDRPKIVQHTEAQPAMPIDTLSDVNSVDDEQFVNGMEKAVYQA